MQTPHSSLNLSAVRAVVARMLLAFRVPGFSGVWASSTLGAMNLMAGSLCAGWLVLELTDSPFWVGAVSAARGIGMLGFGLFAGALIDRLDRRHVLIFSQILNGVVALILAMLVATGQIALWHIIVATLFQGVLSSLRAPTIDTLAYQIVGPQRTLNASAAIATGFYLARVIASAVAGALIALWGVQSGFLFSAVCAFAGGIVVLFISGVFKSDAVAEPFLRAVGAGAKYAWANLQVRRMLSLSVIMELFGFSYNIMLPVVARDVLGVGASGLGLLGSMSGVGAMLATLGVASLGDFKNKSSLLVFTVVSSGAFLVLFGLSRWYIVSLLLAAVLGGTLAAYDVTMKALFLLVSSDDIRGRVQSIYTLTFGFMSLGGFIAGVVATTVGAPFAISLSGGVILAFAFRYVRSFLQMQPGGEKVATAAD